MISRILLLFISLIFISACEQKINHDEKVHYYASITTAVNQTTTSVNNCWNQTRTAARLAQQNQDLILDSTYIDTLNKSLQSSIITLSKSIYKISSISEVDQDLDFKNRVLDHLIDTKQLQERNFPVIFKLLANGPGTLSEDEMKTMERTESIAREIQAEELALKKLSVTFKSKHDITKEDLIKYGL